MIFLATLGKRIRKLRADKGISQEKFAHARGLNRSYMGSVERGERNVSAINLKKMADALGVSVNSLFNQIK